MCLKRWFWVPAMVLCSNCAAPSGSAWRAPAAAPAPYVAPSKAMEVPLYSTEARAGGVLGGAPAQELESELRAELTRRGDSALADGALAATARWILGELTAGRPPD